jgi:DNA-directed RNA polymerase specialized sigma24 family protein
MNPLTAEQAARAATYVGLTIYLARRSCRRRHLRPEAISVALVALCRLAGSHGPTLDDEGFRAYLSRQVRWKVRGLIGEEGRAEGEEDRRPIRTAVTRPEAAPGTTSAVPLREALDCLTERQRFVIRSAYGLDVPYLSGPEIAARLGVSRQRVAQIRDDALGRLAARLRPPLDAGRRAVS